MPSDVEVRRRRALYRASHRGTREMDILLGRFAAARLPELDGEALERFEQLVSLPDTDLYRWILDPSAMASSALEADIRAIRQFHHLAPS